MEISTAETFAKNGWIYVPNLLEKYRCDLLTDHLFLLNKEKKLIHDEQCPISDAIYGDVFLDDLLKSLCQKISTIVNIPLLPTYSYSRIYRTNEVLKVHIDRPSCEISATITLGHHKDSEIWPIFFSDKKKKHVASQIIGIGEAVIYKGTELPHWREKYKGIWQTQVFLHYVDANGPYADCAFDGRAKLGVTKRIKKLENS